jgi:hypothetical protein
MSRLEGTPAGTPRPGAREMGAGLLAARLALPKRVCARECDRGCDGGATRPLLGCRGRSSAVAKADGVRPRVGARVRRISPVYLARQFNSASSILTS